MMKNVTGYHYLWAMFWDQNVSASHTNFNQVIPERKTRGLNLNPIQDGVGGQGKKAPLLVFPL